MPERIVIIILAIICLGQVWTLFRGRFTAVTYYMCVAPLGYFSIWKFFTLRPDNTCGIILIFGCIFLYRRPIYIPRINHHPFFLFVLYVIGITVIGSFFWPVKTMVSARSEAYHSLRAALQILNWIIIAGIAWQVAIVISNATNFERIRKILIKVGILHSLYALYQVFAFYFDLPVTGIRRPYSEVGAAYGVMQYGLDSYFGTLLYRVNSLVGEPKHLGVISLIWISLTFTLFLEGKKDKGLMWKMVLFFVVLLLTYSTVAITGVVIAIFLAVFISFNYKKAHINRFVIAICIITCSVIYIDSINLFSMGKGSIVQILSERTTRTWLSVYKSGLKDLPEIEARHVLSEHPIVLLLGTGLGGISFYIAKNLGGSNVILVPNTGLLAFICDMGLVGILFMLWTFRRTLLFVFLPPGKFEKTTISVAFIGLILFLQCFIFSGDLLPFAFGFLLAAGFRHQHFKNQQGGHPERHLSSSKLSG